MPRTWTILALSTLLGCSQSTPVPRTHPAKPAPAAPVRGAPDLEPLNEPSAFVDLVVPGYGDAVLVVPVGATTPRPVAVVGHGNYDRPEWECHTWRYITRNGMFVLCPRGIERDDIPARDRPRFTYRSDAALANEANAGLAALRARYPHHVAAGPVVYVGFSLGAIFGRSVSAKLEPGVSHAVLVEGGYDAWTPAHVRAFRRRGGARVLFGCGQSVNAAAARRATAHFAGTGVEALIVTAPRAGHSYGGGMVPMLRDAFTQLVEGDPRFASW